MRPEVIARGFALVLALLAGCEREFKPPEKFGNESVEQLKTMHRALEVLDVGDHRALVFAEGESNYAIVFYRKDASGYRAFGTQNHLAGVERPLLRAGWVEARLRRGGAWLRVTPG